MIKVPAGLARELERRGLSEAFGDACGRAEAGGMGGRKAFNVALAEVCPDLSRYRFGRHTEEEKAAEREQETPEERAQRRKRRLSRDRSCNGYRMLEWVVENYGNEAADEFDSPSAAAWSVLNAARKDGDVYRDVLKKYLDAKLKADAAAGDTDTRRMDGQTEYDILEGLDAEVLS